MKPEKEYLKRKQEYLYNRKPERYHLHDVGMGFIVQDTLAHEYDKTKEGDYHLIPEMNKGFGKDKGYKSAQDLIDELNRLDYQVNGNLYDKDKYWVMNTKERLYQELKVRLDDSLKHFTGYDSFKFSMANWENGEIDQLDIKLELIQSGWKQPKEIPPFMEAVLNLEVFNVINKYLDEIENSTDRDDMIRTDTLIELKMRLLEDFGEMQKNPLGKKGV